MFRKTIFSILLSFFLLSNIFVFYPKKAEAWDAIPGHIVDNAMDEILAVIKGITLAAVKQAAVEMILEETEKFMDDVTGIGTRFITDWQDYLVDLPERETTKFMNDYLSGITQGRSSSRYRNQSVGTILSYEKSYEGFGGRDSYEFALAEKARAEGDNTDLQQYTAYNRDAVLENIGKSIIEDDGTMDVTYHKDAGAMFDDGNFGNMSVYLSGINNPWSFSYHIQQKKNAYLEQKKDQQRTVSQAYNGFNGQTEEGMVTRPGILDAWLKINSEDVGNKVIASANTIYEAIVSAVTQAITRSIKQGVGAVKSRAQREIGNVRKKATSQLKSKVKDYGPKAVFENK